VTTVPLKATNCTCQRHRTPPEKVHTSLLDPATLLLEKEFLLFLPADTLSRFFVKLLITHESEEFLSVKRLSQNQLPTLSYLLTWTLNYYTPRLPTTIPAQRHQSSRPRKPSHKHKLAPSLPISSSHGESFLVHVSPRTSSHPAPVREHISLTPTFFLKSQDPPPPRPRLGPLQRNRMGRLPNLPKHQQNGRNSLRTHGQEERRLHQRRHARRRKAS
jgi:hypothetical protein